jgi:hypothetical protein
MYFCRSSRLRLQGLNEMESVNMLGVRQICRNCIALQQVLILCQYFLTLTGVSN